MKKQPAVTAATRQGLMDAFWKIYKEKKIEKISINEITRISGNNRSTFYNYFSDVYDLLHQIEEELMQEITDSIESRIEELDIHEISSLTTDHFFQIVSPVFLTYEEKLFVLIGPDGDPEFAAQLRGHLLENMIRFSFIPEDIPHKDYLMTYIYSSITSLLTYWHQKGKDLSQEEFLRLGQQLTAYGAFHYVSHSRQ